MTLHLSPDFGPALTATAQHLGLAEEIVEKDYWVTGRFPVLPPPLALQTRFAGIVRRITAQKALAQRQLAQSEALFQSLLHGAFRGALTP